MHTQLIKQLPGKTHNNTKDNVATIHNYSHKKTLHKMVTSKQKLQLICC